MRKRCRRRVTIPLPPPGLRPTLRADQRVDLAVVHALTLDELTHGRGSEQTLWDLVGACLTWSDVAHRLGPRIDDEARAVMLRAIDAATAVVLRYRETRRIGVSGPQYQALADAVATMDALAEIVDQPTAMAAAEWSERRLQEMAARVEAA